MTGLARPTNKKGTGRFVIESVDSEFGLQISEPHTMSSDVKITIYRNLRDGCGGFEPIGVYGRNYSQIYNTFCPFKKFDSWYALYSPHYTCTRVMSLSHCIDIGGEDPEINGFCPVDYCILPQHDEKMYGLVAGCVWGDDASWKIQLLDLTNVEVGVIVRKNVLDASYLADHNVRLKDIVNVTEMFEDDHQLEILSLKRFKIEDFDGGDQDASAS